MVKDSLKRVDSIDVPFNDALGERYLAYALSTITSRSLPDVRDGLKPVHRRLLFAMRQLRLDPRSGFKKCARVVGDVIGKYHPHGDTAVYDALVRLAQEFAVRYPLVEGQGNFGNIDGDSAAAMRYTEARLTDYALALLEGIDENAVDFRETYDGTESEPVLIPASVPNILANGASGIAVGMATSIPPHNLDETCCALKHLIRFPNATINKLLSFMPGPDFPTGGVLADSTDNIFSAYKTGKGSFRLRAKWKRENLQRGQWQIIISEIPYQIQKSRLIEKVAELMQAKKLPMLEDIRDESAADIRLVLEPRSKKIEPKIMMEMLFQHTDLEIRVPLNMNVLDADTVPRVMDLRQVLQSFLDHRHEVLVRRSTNRLEKIAARLQVLMGYMLVYLNLDEVINIIRNEDHPKPLLIKRWSLEEIQAEAILNMRLRSLRKLDEIEIRKEIEELEKEQTQLNSLLANKEKRWATITEEIIKIRKRFGKNTVLGKRRTEIGETPSAIVVPLAAIIQKEPITVVCSHMGWIRTVRGHLEDFSSLKFKEGDRHRFALHAQTTDKLLIFGTNGRFYTIGCDKLPGGRGHGEPVRMVTGLGNEHEVVEILICNPRRKLIVAASDGRGFIVKEADVEAQTRGGKQVLNIAGEVVARSCRIIPEESDYVAAVGENHKLIIIPISEISEMSRGRGTKLQSYKDGGLADVKAFKLSDGLQWKNGTKKRTDTNLQPFIGKRAQAGRLAPRGFPRSNRFD